MSTTPALDTPADWMPSTSVVATEHSTMTAWGRDHEVDAYRNVLTEYPEGVLSIVVDSFDVYRAAEEMFGGVLREQVLARDGLLVLRPDSGDPVQVLLRLLPMLAERFGSTRNHAGYRLLHPKVRLLWGDGIGLESVERILDNLLAERWSAANLIFGMGGALLQKVNRDTQKFAFKCSSATVNGELRDVFKEPSHRPRQGLQARQAGTSSAPRADSRRCTAPATARWPAICWSPSSATAKCCATRRSMTCAHRGRASD